MPVLSLEDARPQRTVSHLLEEYLETLTGKSLAQARAQLNKWARPAIGDLPLDQLNPRHIERLHASIPYKRAANTVVDWLHAALRKAERWEYIPRGTNPAQYRGEYRHPERPRRRILTADERSLMWGYLAAEEASGVRHRILRSQAIQFLGHTGLRKGEIIGLSRADVALEAQIPTAYIETHKTKNKTGEGKYCYLSPRAVDLVCRIDTEGNLFPWETATPLDRAWRALRDACGLSGVVLHDVRRTYWSLVGESGVPVEDACETSGHRSMRVHCESYRHISDERKSEIAAIGSAAMVN